MIVDCRCPKCNLAVRGRVEVTIVKDKANHQKVKVCRHCNTSIELKVNDDPTDPGIKEYYYTITVA